MAIITGTVGNDTLYGGNNTVKDTLIGGNGSDIYIIKDTLDVITEAGTGLGDIDTIKLDFNFNLSAYTLNNTNIEVLDGIFLAKNMTLKGNSAVATTIIAGSGNDTITGGTDADTLKGGIGNDTYIIKDTNDRIIDINGSNKIKLDSTFIGSSLSLQETIAYDYSGANIAAIDASAITLTTKALTLTGNATAATIIIGGAGNDSVTGGTAADSLIGGAGNDTLNAGVDILSDTLTGGAGNDIYIINDLNDTIVETLTTGTDTVKLAATFIPSAYTLNNTKVEALDGSLLSKNMSLKGNTTTATNIIGGTGEDSLTGGASSDTLYGGIDVEIDTLNGGTGNDVYIIHDTNDTIIEAPTGGTDTIKIVDPLDTIDISLAQYANIENVDASSISVDAEINGNALANKITGGVNNDTLYGGDDTVKDTLIGGNGSDVYIIKDILDVITETGTGLSDVDTVKLAANFGPLTYSLSNTKIEVLDAGLVANNMKLSGNTATATTITGGAGNDSIIGGTSADSLTGGAGNDTLNGGNDTIADTLDGGIGNDIFIIKDTRDVIIDTNGSNKIKLDSTFTGSSLSLQETSAYDYSGANIATIDASAITLTTKALTLTGNATAATIIIGGVGNDTVTGGTAVDSLIGGAGNDVYIIHDENDVIVENANGGTDTIKLRASSVFPSFNLGSDIKYSNIENIDASALTTTITLKGNNLANTLIGTNASDIIYGGVGADTLIGGKGSDLYFVSNSSNKVIENANEGYDKVILSSDFNSNSFALNSNVEFLDATSVNKAMTLTGSAASGTVTWGTNFNDTINGGSSDDVIMGFLGNDKIYSGAGSDNLDGGFGADLLDGGAGKDFLYGGDDSVSDTLTGGDGQDEYYLRDTKDKIIDNSGGNCIRLKSIYSENEFSLAKNSIAGDSSIYDYSAVDITLLDASKVTTHGLILRGSDQVITTTTTTTIPATGTTPESTTTTTTTSYKDIEIIGTDDNDTIISYGGNDKLWGGGMYIDAVHYGDGDDVFYGGAGSNTFLGGFGDDTYLIDGAAASTTITELTDNPDQDLYYGTDTVKLISTSNNLFDLTKVGDAGKLNGLESFSFTLPENVEILDGSLITGTNLNLTGNSANSLVIGGAGNDTITGGSADDTLSGGEGDDILYGSTGINILDGGNGNDTYQISVADEEALEGNSWSGPTSAPEMKTALTDSGGIDTIILTGKGSYSTEDQETFSLTLPTDIDNLDASTISKDLSLIITGNDLDNIITGGTGRDTIDTGDGDDTVYDYAEYIDPSGTRWYSGNVINVGDGNNTVITGIGSDDITAGDGDDFVYDAGGNNIIDVGSGSNRVYSGGGNDVILADQGDDFIISGDGANTVYAGDGLNTLNGGSGDDTYLFADTYLASGVSGNTTITDAAGNDSILFDASVDTNDVAVFKDSSGNLHIDFGATSGTETITINNSTIEKIQLDDDSFISNTDINTIIQNMMTYAADNSITIASISDVKSNVDLMNIIAVGWHL